jgi:hypothetical protein
MSHFDPREHWPRLVAVAAIGLATAGCRPEPPPASSEVPFQERARPTTEGPRVAVPALEPRIKSHNIKTH